VTLRDGSHDTADEVILAVPAYQASEMIRGIDPELAARLGEIEYASSAIVNVAYRRADVDHPLDAFGFVVPASEGRSIIGCSFSSVKFPARAPAGEVLCRVFLGGAMQPEVLRLGDDELKAEVRRELMELIGARGQPLFIEVARHPKSMPQYAVGHLDRVAEIERLATKHAGLHLAGNAYHGVGIPDCIASGERAAEGIGHMLAPESQR
jgi:oxygen-dependent protoporphyrinogen oxidase